jgi:hypothetical protein
MAALQCGKISRSILQGSTTEACRVNRMEWTQN